MVGGERVDELRRIAFGRDSTAEERADAIRALQEREQSREPEHAEPLHPPLPPAAAIATAASVTPSEVPESESEPAPAPAPADAVRPVARIRAIWLIPIIAASLALGGIGATLSGGRDQRSTVPRTPAAEPTVPVVANGADASVGDLAAAEKVFTALATNRDLSYAHLDLIPSLLPATVRYLGGDDGLVQVWVGKESGGEICLLLDQDGMGAASCNDTRNFVAQGISLGINQYSASWNGRQWAISSPYGYRQGMTGP